MATSTRRESSFEEPLHSAGEPDYYAILGLTAAATDEEIRQAYRSLAMRWHPDHYTMASEEVARQAERRMRAINRARDVLDDPALRRDYDRRHGEHHTAAFGPYDARQGYHAWHSATFSNHVPAASHHDAHLSYHTRNPNGAGMLFSTLSIILALAIGGRLLSSGGGSFIGTSVGLLIVLTLLGLAAFFATETSLLARAATAYLEHEPNMADIRTRRRARGERHDAHHNGHHPHPHPATTHESHESRAEHHTPYAEGEEPTPFEQLVDEALASIPEQFAEHMRNVVVRVKDEPDEEALRRMEVPPGHTLLGLYEGVPLTMQGAHGAQPEIVTVYQGPIERYCHHNSDRIRAQVRATVLHELAHHFGIDHDDMPEWVK